MMISYLSDIFMMPERLIVRSSDQYLSLIIHHNAE